MERSTQRDLIVGAVTGYNFDQIAPWVNSLDRSGFSGYKVVLAYNMDVATVRELVSRKYTVLAFEQDPVGNLVYKKNPFSIVVERFMHYYMLLSHMNDVRYILATDVKDVIFQHNPSAHLEYYLEQSGKHILASCEELTYEQEPWGNNNLLQSFGPHIHKTHLRNMIYNAGVTAGEAKTYLGMCKTIALMCGGAPQFVPGGGGPDQAAYNILLDTPVYQECTFFANHSSTWAAQLGTTMDPTKRAMYQPHIGLCRPAYSTKHDLVMNPRNEPYAIVHQWDRVPEVRAMVERKYRV